MATKLLAGGDWADALSIPTTVTFSATPNFDLSTGNYFTITATGNITSSTFTNVPTDATRLRIRIVQDATGGRTAVFPTTVRYAGGAQGNTTTASTASAWEFVYDVAAALWLETGRVIAVPVT
jgi:hypothetical protein